MQKKEQLLSGGQDGCIQYLVQDECETKCGNEITRQKMCLNLRIYINPLLLRLDYLYQLYRKIVQWCRQVEMWKPRLWNARTKALTSTYRCLMDEFFEDIFPLVFQDLSFRLQQKSQGKFSFACWVVEYYQLMTYQHCPKGCWNSWYFFERVQGANFVQGSISKRGRKVLDNSHTWRIMLAINGDRDFPK